MTNTACCQNRKFISTTINPTFITAADLNHDGKMDLIIGGLGLNNEEEVGVRTSPVASEISENAVTFVSYDCMVRKEPSPVTQIVN